jgi:xylulokinase
MNVIGYDVGTTGFKAALYEVSSEEIRLIASEIEHYPLRVLPNGGAEQDAEDWWRAMCSTTRKLIEKTGTPKTEIKGIACCSQCCTLVMVDENGHALRPAMSIMDTRASEQFRRTFCSGVTVAGYNAGKLSRFMRATSAAPLSAKDTVYRYLWVKENEPEIFRRTYKWLDTKEYLNARATGKMKVSRDDAYLTFLYDPRSGTWREDLCRLVGVDREHLPAVCDATDRIGDLLPAAAEELGLAPGTAVISGGNDVSLCQVGSGALEEGDVNICSGTSGWVSTITNRMQVDIRNGVGTLVGADPCSYLYMADCETAGKCMEWVKERLSHTPMETYREMIAAICGVPAGSNGVIFSPWMHGNRCPFEDANVRGLFFNVDVDNRSGDLIKSVIEGVCMHMRWLLEVSENKVRTNPVIRFSGGSALSPEVAQILSDVTGREIEVIEHPRQAGTMGAAAIVAAGLGIAKDIRGIKPMIRIAGRFEPDLKNKAVYDRVFPVFKALYRNNKKAYADLNA